MSSHRSSLNDSVDLSAVEISGVRKVYGIGHGAVLALDNVFLTITEHEFVCLLGPSGCGKTTLLNILAGFEFPSSGSVQSYGHPIAGPGPDRTMVFQEYALFPWLTVAQNIQYGLRRRGLSGAECRKVSNHYIELIDLKGFEGKFPRQLSGGMRQRVAIARALAVCPQLLLMDEPFAALDSFTRERMQDELIRVWEHERKVVVFVTHSIDEAIRLADRIVVMSPRPGRISKLISIKSPRPRDRTSPEAIKIVQEVREILHDPSVASARIN